MIPDPRWWFAPGPLRAAGWALLWGALGAGFGTRAAGGDGLEPCPVVKNRGAVPWINALPEASAGAPGEMLKASGAVVLLDERLQYRNQSHYTLIAQVWSRPSLEEFGAFQFVSPKNADMVVMARVRHADGRAEEVGGGSLRCFVKLFRYREGIAARDYKVYAHDLRFPALAPGDIVQYQVSISALVQTEQIFLYRGFQGDIIHARDDAEEERRSRYPAMKIRAIALRPGAKPAPPALQGDPKDGVWIDYVPVADRPADILRRITLSRPDLHREPYRPPVYDYSPRLLPCDPGQAPAPPDQADYWKRRRALKRDPGFFTPAWDAGDLFDFKPDPRLLAAAFGQIPGAGTMSKRELAVALAAFVRDRLPSDEEAEAVFSDASGLRKYIEKRLPAARPLKLTLLYLLLLSAGDEPDVILLHRADRGLSWRNCDPLGRWFDEAVLSIETGTGRLYLDPGRPLPVGTLDRSCAGAEAIRLGAAHAPEWLTIPSSVAGTGRVETEITLALRDSFLSGRVVIAFRGDPALRWRERLLGLPPARRAELARESLLARAGEGVEAGEFAISGVEAPEAALEMSATIRVSPQRIGGKFRFPRRLLSPAPAAAEFAADSRQTDLFFNTPREYRTVTRIAEGGGAFIPPAGADARAGDARYRRTVAGSPDDALTVEETLTLPERVPQEAYGEFRGFLRGADGD